MTLEEILYKVNSVLVVESLSFDSTLAEQQRIKIERELSSIYEKPITIELVDYKAVDASTLTNRDSSLVIFNAQSDNELLSIPVQLLETRRLSDRLRVLSPSAEYIIFSNLGEVDPKSLVRKALEMILSKIDREDDGYLDHMVGNISRILHRETVLEYLNDQVVQIRHSIGGKKDAAFIRELSEIYMDGNCQTLIGKTFLIISNRLDCLAGKFDIVQQGTDFSSVDFRKYAAVFVDNNYSFKDGENCSKLGQGIDVLERLSALGVRLPIIYQTAHLLEDFTDDDIRRLRAFENVLLMPKNRAFKICRSNQAKKEIALDEILSDDPLLLKYSVSVSPIGEKGYLEHEGYAIIATNAVQNIPGTLFIDGFGLNEDIYSHRLAVLAAFHTRMRSELTNPVFANTVDYLRSWNTIEEKLAACGIEIKDIDQKRELYCYLKNKHDAEHPTTIIHNDPKWDNWFKNYVLGDFSDCAPGTEYKDIARTLLDKETDFSRVCDESWVDSHIEFYVSARKQLDSKFELPNYFAANVKELIFMESLRLARFKSQTQGNDNVVNGLLSVAHCYHEVLRDSYSTMPKIGDNAPYRSLSISI